MKEGDVIVRILRDSPWAPLGYMAVVLFGDLYDALDGSRTQIVPAQWRKATQEETNAYKRGVRNINDIEDDDIAPFVEVNIKKEEVILKYVTCIDASSAWDGIDGPLREGEKYPVLKETENGVLIKVDDRNWSFGKHRFAEYNNPVLDISVLKGTHVVVCRHREDALKILKLWDEEHFIKHKWAEVRFVESKYIEVAYLNHGFAWNDTPYIADKYDLKSITFEEIFNLKKEEFFKVCDKKVMIRPKLKNIYVGCKEFTLEELQAVLIVSDMCKKGVELTFNDLGEIDINSDGGESELIKRDLVEKIIKKFK